MPSKAVSRANWSRPLPQPLVIPDVMTLMTLTTLADVRAFVTQRPPKLYRDRPHWLAVARDLEAAARGGDLAEVSMAIRMALLTLPTADLRWRAVQRLPAAGDAAINVLNDFTPLVERISIDEAFADVAGCTHLFGSPNEIAAAIRRRVRTQLGLPISIGVARTKHLAKIASQVAKPDGLVVVDPGTELDFLHDLPVELMWGVGPVTRTR
jgi:nucleotidyltransferase/DNA polymerase involved in DNA repair